MKRRLPLGMAVLTILVLGFSALLFNRTGAAPAIKHPVDVPYDEAPKPIVGATPSDAAMLSREQVQVKVPVDDAVPLGTAMMSWGQFMAEYSARTRDYQIDPERKVWVVRQFYPNGVSTRRGVMTNAVVSTAYDAVTGDVLAVLHKSLPIGSVPPELAK